MTMWAFPHLVAAVRFQSGRPFITFEGEPVGREVGALLFLLSMSLNTSREPLEHFAD